jgi:hypothetical protein
LKKYSLSSLGSYQTYCGSHAGKLPFARFRMAERDRYRDAAEDMASHIGEKVMSVLRHPDNQARLQSILDPVINHIIQRVFPYILLSAILFLILFVLTVGTFWLVMRSNRSPIVSSVAAVASALS